MSLSVAWEVGGDPLLAAEDAYDQAATLYDGWKWQTFWRRAEEPFIVRALGDFAPARPGLLDVGCGTGWYLRRLEPICARTAGIDVSQGMLTVARERAPRATLRKADAESLLFPADAFDAVLSTRVLSHIADPRRPLDEIARVLAPGGVAIVSDVDADHDYTHTRLPVADGHVLARTFKHPRTVVAAALTAAGLTHRRSLLVLDDGRVAPTGELGDPDHRSVTGWVTAWSKGRQA